MKRGLQFIKLAGLLAVFCFAFLPSSASADPACVSENLSLLIDTTCDVGSLQFTFTDFGGSKEVDNIGGPTFTSWDASDFTFTPVADGFTISLNSGPLSDTAPSSDHFVPTVDDAAVLSLTVTDLGGNFSGVGISADLSSSGTNENSASVSAGFACTDCAGGMSTQLYVSDNGTITGNPATLSPPPFSSASGDVEIFNLSASNGDNAYWGGSTTVTFDTAPTVTPEPSTSILFVTGAALLLGPVIYRRRHSRISVAP